jgi:tetratricopeptide (TPR) repeat protein
MGYEMAHSIATAMEQMNKYYRQVFEYKQRGGSKRSCGLRVYATRADFERVEGEREAGVRGFFVPLENRVATYDPRSEGRPLSSLWSTLFHEASHQFTEATTTNLMPGWLNEGTASYFEGAALLPSGQVVANRVPDHRLRNLLVLLDRGSPTLKEVVSYFEGGSYDGSFYPFGWGLVYFIQNYENEKSERVYIPIYRDYMKTYTKGGEHDVVGRFVEYFVKKAAQPGVASFEQFEEHWRAWIRDLGEIHFGPPAKADVLLERARKQVANKQLENARETYGRALEKRPDLAPALLERAEVLLEQDEVDGALFDLRKLLQLARGQADPEAAMPGFVDQSAADVARDCLTRITKVQSAVGKAIGETYDEFVAAAGSAAEDFVAAGFPRGAVHLIETSLAVLGGDAVLAGLGEEIRARENLDLRRWRRMTLEDGLALWEAGAAWKAVGGEIQLETDGLVTCTRRDEAPEAYRYEATVLPGEGGDFPVYGLVFGSNNLTGAKMFALLPKARMVGLVELREGPEIAEDFKVALKTGEEQYHLAIEVRRGHAEFFLNGEKAGAVDYHPGELRGSVGVFGQDTKAAFSGLRLRY